jgi:hypothetical protein
MHGASQIYDKDVGKSNAGGAAQVIDDRNVLDPLKNIAKAFLAGKVVPFLGADINLCDRSIGTDGLEERWTPGADFPPSNQELAIYLDHVSQELGPRYQQEMSCPFLEGLGQEVLPSQCPLRNGGENLKLPIQNVSQYVASGTDGEVHLYEALGEIFCKDFQPNSIHRFLAGLPALLRSKSKTPSYPLIVTACFDNALEKAFEEAGEAIDLVGFVGEAQGGRFQHIAPDGLVYEIDPNKDTELDLNKRPILLKLYRGYTSEVFQITEDNYIDYLSHTNMTGLIPVSLLRILNESKLLFLGYNLSLWNQRVILRRLWQQKLDMSGKFWWSIPGRPDPFDVRMWNRYSVKVLQKAGLRLGDYIETIQELLESLSTPVSSVTPVPAEKTRSKGIFFSYSHKDKDWLVQIKTMLAPLIRSGQLPCWDDTQIPTGAHWMNEIKTALAQTKVAVLLVSDDFLNSDFIAQHELPVLLEAAERKELTLFPVAISPCLYDLSDLKEIQSTPDIATPLSSMSENECKTNLATIAHKIKQAFDHS